VFGFVTRDAGIKIHRMSCPNAARLLTLYPYRIQKVRWADTPSSGHFQVTLKVTSDFDGSIPGSIMDAVNSFKASLRAFNVIENPRSSTYEITMKIAVPSNLELDKVISRIKQMRGVHKISRG
jgi:GTP pyrophosphokinase